mmetsp:Transcript_20391/g.44286  ORF Transcript_20391/g.44286 Transcript_20391/m.44286 type:complete len:246 (-) Transcript_20391:312-1049(-)
MSSLPSWMRQRINSVYNTIASDVASSLSSRPILLRLSNLSITLTCRPSLLMTLLFSFSANVNAIPIKLVYITSPGTRFSFFMYCNTSSVSFIMMGVALRRQSDRHPHVTEFGFTPNFCIVLKSFIAVSVLPILPHAFIAAVHAPTSLKRACWWYMGTFFRGEFRLASDFCFSMIRSPFKAKSLRLHLLQTSMSAQYVTPLGVMPSLIIRFNNANAISGSFSPPLLTSLASLSFIFFLATVDMSIV